MLIKYDDPSSPGLTTLYTVLEPAGVDGYAKTADWSTATLAQVATAATWRLCVIALTDSTGAGHYRAIVSPTSARWRYKVRQASGSPATTALYNDEIVSGEDVLDWIGTAENGADGTPRVNVSFWLDNDAQVDGDGRPVVNIGSVDPNAANTGPLADINQSIAALPTAAEIAQQVGETIVGNGSGDTAVDHDGATGVTVDGEPSEADVMRFTLPGGGGADGVEVVAYLTADYDAGNRATANRQGTTVTGSDGRWVAPLMLDAGTYTILGSKGGYVVAAVTVVVP